MALNIRSFYNKHISHEYIQKSKFSEELCIICLFDETEEGMIDDKDKLICGHIFHTDCFQIWTDTKQSLNCPLCGDIPLIEKNKRCSNCLNFCKKGNLCPLFNLISSRDSTSNNHNSRKLEKRIINLQKSFNPNDNFICKICKTKLISDTLVYKREHYATEKCMNASKKLFDFS